MYLNVYKSFFELFLVFKGPLLGLRSVWWFHIFLMRGPYLPSDGEGSAATCTAHHGSMQVTNQRLRPVANPACFLGEGLQFGWNVRGASPKVCKSTEALLQVFCVAKCASYVLRNGVPTYGEGLGIEVIGQGPGTVSRRQPLQVGGHGANGAGNDPHRRGGDPQRRKRATGRIHPGDRGRVVDVGRRVRGVRCRDVGRSVGRWQVGGAVVGRWRGVGVGGALRR